MALYTELPIYRDTYQLILRIFEITKEFSKEYKYTLRQNMKRDALSLMINTHEQLFGTGCWHRLRQIKDMIHWVTNSYWLKKACLKFNYPVLIGRSMRLAKHGGQLGRSRMKSDATTKSAGYAAVFGFNLRQLTRCLAGEVHPKVDVVNNIGANNANII